MRNIRWSIGLCMLMLIAQPLQAAVQRQVSRSNNKRFVLNQEQASHFAQLALKCARKEYPNKIDHVMSDESQVRAPK
ncbi:MAG TPA: hypothetical protein VJM12_07680, partial [Pyrinomonadaceae bacterium]|nr:hypothetical protein [Pyrinomonadaceae bacterium]